MKNSEGRVCRYMDECGLSCRLYRIHQGLLSTWHLPTLKLSIVSASELNALVHGLVPCSTTLGLYELLLIFAGENVFSLLGSGVAYCRAAGERCSQVVPLWQRSSGIPLSAAVLVRTRRFGSSWFEQVAVP